MNPCFQQITQHNTLYISIIPSSLYFVSNIPFQDHFLCSLYNLHSFCQLILRLTFILLFVLTLQLRGKFEKRDFATTPQIIFLCADDFLRQLLMVRGRTETPMILNRILHPCWSPRLSPISGVPFFPVPLT